MNGFGFLEWQVYVLIAVAVVTIAGAVAIIRDIRNM